MHDLLAFDIAIKFCHCTRQTAIFAAWSPYFVIYYLLKEG